MKILQVVPYFYPAWAYGGIPRVVYELSKELVRKGHEVTVYTTDALDAHSRNSSGGKTVTVDGIKVHYLRNLSNGLAYNYQLFLPLGLNRLAGQNIASFDVIHLHGHRNILNNIIHYHAKKNNKAYVLSGHGTIPRIERRIFVKTLFDKLFGNRVLRDAGCFVAVSESEVKQYEEMRVRKEKVRVIYNGIDTGSCASILPTGKFRRKYNLEGRQMILYLGKITPRKGLDFLVRSFAGLNDDNTVLVIAGNDMGFRKEVEKTVRENSLDDKVIFTGLLVGEDKLAAYRDADVLVYPAIHEIFGLVPFEAIMCGTPVIVTDDCGCGEIIGREGLGYTVRYNDIPGLRDRIIESLKERDTMNEMVKKGREFVMSHLNWGLIGDKYVEVYRGVVN
jgi:glycosyltransferase involved in cell wall biosynthesis